MARSLSPSPTASPSTRNLVVRERSNGRSVSGSKRKRTDTVTPGPVATSRARRMTTATSVTDLDRETDIDTDADNDLSDGNASEYDAVYDPDQPLEERRRVQNGFRKLLRDLTDNNEEYLKADSRGLHDTILKADLLSKQVKQTSEATIDSRLLVSTTDLSYRKTLRLAQGSLTQGVDVDEFVSKCITYMRQGRGIVDDEADELSSTQRRRRQTTRRRTGHNADGDDVGDEGDMMNWSHLGRFACAPFSRRPALPGFLLGPLSVEKKARKITKRSAPFRPNNLVETRPEVIDVQDIGKEKDHLAARCGRIRQLVKDIQVELQQKVNDAIEDDMTEQEKFNIMHQSGLRSTGGIDLMRFVVNPKSFGQTVENLFYVSFLIKDGHVDIELDEHGLPSLAPSRADSDEEDEPKLDTGAMKHQAILSMDMEIWQDIIDTMNITEPMIEHRKASNQSGPGARGWYG